MLPEVLPPGVTLKDYDSDNLTGTVFYKDNIPLMTKFYIPKYHYTNYDTYISNALTTIKETTGMQDTVLEDVLEEGLGHFAASIRCESLEKVE